MPRSRVEYGLFFLLCGRGRQGRPRSLREKLGEVVAGLGLERVWIVGLGENFCVGVCCGGLVGLFSGPFFWSG